MKYAGITLVAVAALIWAVPASAQLVAHPQCNTLHCQEASQKHNLAHATFVCNNGANYPKRWSCQAVKWLTRELNETRAALRPSPGAAYGVPRCGSSCVYCESKFDPDAWNGDDYWGWYQFDYGTWKAAGGIPSHWGKSSTSSAEQTAVARRVTYNAWPNC